MFRTYGCDIHVSEMSLRRTSMFPEISLCCDIFFVIIAWCDAAWLFKSHEMCYRETSCCCQPAMKLAVCANAPGSMRSLERS